MRALEEKTKSYHSYENNKDKELVLFKIVVNNYKQQQKGSDVIVEDDIVANNHVELGLPPQPASYIKYPTYDWL